MTGAGGSEHRRLERTNLMERELGLTTLAAGWLCRSHISLHRALLTESRKNVSSKRETQNAKSQFWSSNMFEAVRNLGYRTVLGSVYPHVPQIHNARINVAHVLRKVRPGAIILIHHR